MIVDLHSHYPLHLLADEPATLDLMLSTARTSFRDKIRARVLQLANRIDNYPGSGTEPAVTITSLENSNVRVALSALYSPFDEMDLEEAYGAPPRPRYFTDLLKQIDMVEQSVAGHSDVIVVAHNPAELQAALTQHKVALIHAVEGGFHIGDTEDAVRANVRTLAERGVACITVAHLFWRRIATNAPAIPFLADWIYSLLFPQRRSGLDALGRALIRAMVANRILVDVTHMSARSIDDTLALLDEIDPEASVPVIATHSATKINGPQYNISDAHIAAVARRRGVVGLIACRHWMAQGVREPKTFADTMEAIYRHVDRIHAAAGSHSCAAFGSDQDGFIKPTLPGLETPEGFKRVEEELVKHYGPDVAEQICSGNAMRVLGYWKGGWGPEARHAKSSSSELGYCTL